MSTHNNINLKHMLHNGAQVKKWFHNGVQVFSAGNSVIYYVGLNETYSEEVDSGESCLSPTTFTPTKDGWSFVGWREDTTPSSEVLTEKIMDSEPITLYAVFVQDITLTYYDDNEVGENTKPRYLNYYHYANPTFSLTQLEKDDWSAIGWSKSTSAMRMSGMYNNSEEFALEQNTTLYGLYSKWIGPKYDGNGATSGMMMVLNMKEVLYNSSGETSSYPTFTLAENEYKKDGYSFVAWALGSPDGARWNVGDEIMLTDNTTFYAVWEADEVTAYSATYSGGYMETAEVTANDETYMDSTADYHYHDKLQGVSGATSTKTGTLLALTEEAKKFKYAKITIAYQAIVNFGGAKIGYRLDTETNLTYLIDAATTSINENNTVELVVDTTEVSSITYHVSLENSSSASAWLASGAIGIQSVILTNEV